MKTLHKRIEIAKQLLDSDDCDVSDQIFQIDGYAFGDRLLEGVKFNFKLDEDCMGITVTVDPSAEAYFNRLNTALWLESAIDHVCSTDIVSGFEDGEEMDWLIEDKDLSVSMINHAESLGF